MFSKKVNKLFERKVKKVLSDFDKFEKEFEENEKEINEFNKQMKEWSANTRLIRRR
jgi:peptidoglycan hydrolase CwlO-like protein